MRKPLPGGVATRTRKVKVAARHGGKACGALSETKKCKTGPCPVDCKLSPWGLYSKCSKSCGAGKQSRVRVLSTKPKFNGQACGAMIQTKICRTEACPVDCKVSRWGKYGSCSKSCGAGRAKRFRKVLTQPAHGGKACPSVRDTKKCNARECPVHCLIGDWSYFTECDKTCGSGKKTRTRVVTQTAAHGGLACPALKETKACSTNKCPRDCKVSAWSGFSKCTVSCGFGTHQRTRSIDVLPKNGGVKCPVLIENSICNTQKCPVDCELGAWGPFGECSKTCGVGTRTRARSLLAAAKFGGKKCGSKSQTGKCVQGHCPVGCKVGKWSKFSACSKTCGVGVKTATRKVRWHRKNAGYQCPSLTKTVQCETAKCPLNCRLSASWSDWKECSVSCGGGYKSRTKHVLRKALFNGVCKHTVDTKKCNQQACPVDCKAGAWTKYGACSKSCGKGTHIRTRTIVQKRANGGMKCPHTEEEKNCNAGPCPVHCQYSKWSKWTVCTKSCGSGTRSRTRSVVSKPKHGGIRCSSFKQAGSCGTIACPADCKMGKWSQWSKCTRTCGAGLQSRSRKVLSEPVNGGKLCPAKFGSKKCQVVECPVHCAVSKWSKFDKCSQKCGGGIQVATRSVVTYPKFGGDSCPILQNVQRCNYQSCSWTEVKAPKAKKAKTYTLRYTTGSLKYGGSKSAVKVSLVGTKGRSKFYTIGSNFPLGKSGSSRIEMNEDIGLLFGLSIKATSSDGWNTVNFINVHTPSKQIVQFRTDYWMTTKQHKTKLAYKTYPYAQQVGIKAVNAEEGLKKATKSVYEVTYKTSKLPFSDSKQAMFIQLHGSYGKTRYYKLADSFKRGATATVSLDIAEHVGLLKAISLEAGGKDAWHATSVSIQTPSKQTIDFKTDFWLDDQPMHGKKYFGKHFYYQKEVDAVKREVATKLTNIYEGRAEVKLPTRAPTVATKVDFAPLVKAKTGVTKNTANSKNTAAPTSKPTAAPTPKPKKQCQNGAAFVTHGWHGAGAGGNYCNFCKCNNGKLTCTKRKCGIPNQVPARAKTCANVKCSWTMQVRGKEMKAPKHHIEVSHHHAEVGPNHRCAFNAATKKCTCYCWGSAKPSYATKQHGRAAFAKKGFQGTQCTDIKFKTPFDASKGAVKVVTSITHMSPTPKWEHDAPISWVEYATATGFQVCVRESKNYWHSFDKHDGRLHIDYYATQKDAPWKGAELKAVKMGQKWKQGETHCSTVQFAKEFETTPFVVGSIDHQEKKITHDALTHWIENINTKEFKVCFREPLFYDDWHMPIYFNYLAFTHANPQLWYGNQKNYAGAGRVAAGEWKLYEKSRVNNKKVYLNCKDVKFPTPYAVPPTILVTANHQDPYNLDWSKTHDALMTYVDDVYTTHFKVCSAELKRHDGYHKSNVNFDWVAFA